MISKIHAWSNGSLLWSLKAHCRNYSLIQLQYLWFRNVDILIVWKQMIVMTANSTKYCSKPEKDANS